MAKPKAKTRAPTVRRSRGPSAAVQTKINELTTRGKRAAAKLREVRANQRRETLRAAQVGAFASAAGGGAAAIVDAMAAKVAPDMASTGAFGAGLGLVIALGGAYLGRSDAAALGGGMVAPALHRLTLDAIGD